MLPESRNYDELYRRFRWSVPAQFNIGVAACDRWAEHDPDKLAIDRRATPTAAPQELSYGWLRDTSNRLANALAAHGIERGDRVAILLPQAPEVAAIHIAVYKLGGIAVPLAILFGVEAIAYRLQNSGAKARDHQRARARRRSRRSATNCRASNWCCRSTVRREGALGFDETLARASSDFTPRATAADDPAMMIYTSGTTGQPKGALHAHRVLLGHLPGIEIHHEFFPQPGDRIWTPADWAWAGGLLNVLLPGLYYGVPVVARRFDQFDPEEAFALMARQGVRNAFIPPTALRMLRSAPSPQGRHDIKLRTVGSGGEALGAETFEWGRSALGLVINEFYGQTECNLVLSACGAIGVRSPARSASRCPATTVAVIRPDGTRADAGELGQIAVRRPDPVMFLEYWGKPDATREKFIGDWMTTGDQGVMDDDGYFRFVGRDDDVITSSGYRIGPGEIEDCLIKHPAVSLAAVIGKPDPVRTEIVKAFIVLKRGQAPSDALAADIQEFVRTRLSAHEYPREVAFIDEMPMTTTGKVIRRLLRTQA